MDAIRVTLKRKVVDVEVEKEDGSIGNYKLIEMTGEDRDVYLDKLSKRTKMNSEGRPTGISSFKDMEAMLIAVCLKNDKEEFVTMKEIQTFPASAVHDLHTAAQEINSLNDVGAEEVKNESKVSV